MSEVSHGGNMDSMAAIAGCDKRDILDFSANINPLGFPEWLRPLINSQISNLVHYPDPEYSSLKEAFTRVHLLAKDEIIFGNGVSEILYLLPGILQADLALLPVPSYGEYEEALKLYNIPIEYMQLNENMDFKIDYNSLESLLSRHKEERILIMLGHPNNPTGKLLDKQKILSLCEQFKNAIFIIDESFIDFCARDLSFRYDRPENMVILWSFTKILAIPGLRAGVCLAAKETMLALQKKIPPWSLNSIAAAVLERALDDSVFFQQSQNLVLEYRKKLSLDIEQTEIFKVFPGNANFILLKILQGEFTSKTLREKLIHDFQIGVRECESFRGLGANFIRVAVRKPEENEKLLTAFTAIYQQVFLSSAKRHKRKTPALMLQGTGSNVGKSILTSALCRIMYQDGFKVAPFKSQNMALNSFVTISGGEIGRAQALQAQACKILPDTRMNPILLKPSNDSDSQVILNGKPLGAGNTSMDFREYTKIKSEVFLEAQKAYDSLASEYDVMILEGAGSASEVNLKKNDIVNMRMARYAQAKVLLVGNIDYGGLFGSMLGTMETLAEWERDLVGGFIINRFRGIKELLIDGVSYLEKYTGKSVVGIVPFINKLSLPEEDSLEFKSGSLRDDSPLGDRIDIALIDFPRIANHTDVDALRVEPDVRVRIVRSIKELGCPDVIILPGSKNVITDLDFLNETGLSEAIKRLAFDGKSEVVGICGGYQMLGEKISDPHQIETNRGDAVGLGLLPIATILEKEKFLKQVSGKHLSSGKIVKGYEIHHGKSQFLKSKEPLIVRDDGQAIGYSSAADTKIWGSYLHGIFDEDEFRRWFIDQARIKKGMRPLNEIQSTYNLESELDNLAQHVRESLDMKLIYQMIGLSC